MKKLLSKKLIITVCILFIFILVTYLVSRSGMYFFSDSNMSLWKDNKYLLNIYSWAEDDYGFFAPMFITNLPIQLFFKLLTLFSNIYFVSVFYFFAVYLGLIVSTVYLIKNVNKNAKTIDYILVTIFAISNPVSAYVILYEQDIAYSFIFITLFIAYLFKCKNKNEISISDIVVLEIILLLINTYILSSVLIVACFIIYIIYSYKSLLEKKVVFKYLFSVFLFLLLNAYWIIVPISQFFQKASSSSLLSFYTIEGAKNVLGVVSQQVRLFSPFMFSSSYIRNPNNSLYFFSRPEIVVSSFIILILIFYIVLLGKNVEYFKNRRSLIYFLFILFLIFFNFSLGTRSPFGWLFTFFWDKVPFFNLFRAIFKFQFVINFSFIILFIIGLSKTAKYVKYLLLIPMLILMSFYFRDHFFKQLMVTYKIPQYYFDEQANLDKKKLNVNYKIFPDKYYGSKFIYTQFDWSSTQWDATNILKYFTRQTTITTPSSAIEDNSVITNDLCNLENHNAARDIGLLKKTMALLNIKTIIMQNDILKNRSSCFAEINDLAKYSIGKLDNYSLSNEETLLKFYVPDKIFKQKVNETNKETISENESDITSSFYQDQTNINVTEINTQLKNNTPKLEYKKINPTKYRVIIRKTKVAFPLIFSESFQSGWKAYPISFQRESKDDLTSKVDSDYHIFDGNSEVQASKSELVDFINKGLISNNDNKNQIDFVSKDINGTIQNDNLKNNGIAETWFKTPLDENDHLEVNGFANSWIIDPNKICNGNNKCVNNADGSHDMELVVEFWPQRSLDIGLLVSGGGLVGCLIFLAYKWLKNKRLNYAKKNS